MMTRLEALTLKWESEAATYGPDEAAHHIFACARQLRKVTTERAVVNSSKLPVLAGEIKDLILDLRDALATLPHNESLEALECLLDYVCINCGYADLPKTDDCPSCHHPIALRCQQPASDM